MQSGDRNVCSCDWTFRGWIKTVADDITANLIQFDAFLLLCYIVLDSPHLHR